MVAPLVVGGLIGLGSFLFGKNAGGGAIEIGTSKKSTQTTDSRQYTTSNVYSPTINRTTDISYNIASGGSNISTKKEQSVSQAPTTSPIVSPILTATPITSQGGGTSASDDKGGVDFQGLALLGGVGLVAYFLLKPENKKNAK